MVLYERKDRMNLFTCQWFAKWVTYIDLNGSNSHNFLVKESLMLKVMGFLKSLASFTLGILDQFYVSEN